jgi:tetratricopeptide (TPR) repeat protein
MNVNYNSSTLPGLGDVQLIEQLNAHISSRNIAAATEVSAEAVRRYGMSLEVLLLHAQLLQQHAPGVPIRSVYQRALQFYEDVVLVRFPDLLKPPLSEKYPTVFLRIAECYEGVDLIVKAIEFYELTLRFEGLQEIALKKLVELCVQEDELQKALMHFEKYTTLTKSKEGPFSTEILEQLTCLQNQKKKSLRPIWGTYPAMEQFEGDLGEFIRDALVPDLIAEKFISDSSKVFTIGSCFADNLAKAMRSLGLLAFSASVGEHVNNTASNLSMIEYLAFPTQDKSKTVERIESLLASAGISIDQMRSSLMEANIFVMTLGVAGGFFDTTNNNVIVPDSVLNLVKQLGARYEFRFMSVNENLENVSKVIQTVKNLNDKIKIILTVSPVPLSHSFGTKSALVADCLSKSTLRVVASEICRIYPEVIYWPSFEIFRWVGSTRSSFYGEDDHNAGHPSSRIIAQTINSFIDTFSLDSTMLGRRVAPSDFYR